MIKTVSRLAAATAALGLVAAPIMAQANTRAGDNSAVYSVGDAAPGLGRADDGEGVKGGGGVGLLLLGGAVFITGILIATDVIGGDDDCASPGTC